MRALSFKFIVLFLLTCNFAEASGLKKAICAAALAGSSSLSYVAGVSTFLFSHGSPEIVLRGGSENSRSLNVAVFGDSLLLDFQVTESGLQTLANAKHRVAAGPISDSQPLNGVDSIFERLCNRYNVCLVNHATPMARISSDQTFSLTQSLVSSRNLSTQIDQAIEQQPDIALSWIGHTDLDVIDGSIDESGAETLAVLKAQDYTIQLERLLESSEATRVLVFALGDYRRNLPAFHTLQNERDDRGVSFVQGIESTESNMAAMIDPKLTPWTEMYFESFHRELGRRILDLGERHGRGRILLSDGLSRNFVVTPAMLSSDGVHLNEYGQAFLAELLWAEIRTHLLNE